MTLKQAGVRKPVYLMALFPESLAPELARLGVRPCLYSDDALRLVEPMVRTVGGPIEAEVYLDTGMSRMGIPYHKALSWIESVLDSGKVRVGGVFMGFTEDPEYDEEQLRRFMSVAIPSWHPARRVLVRRVRASRVPFGHGAAGHGSLRGLSQRPSTPAGKGVSAERAPPEGPGRAGGETADR